MPQLAPAPGRRLAALLAAAARLAALAGGAPPAKCSPWAGHGSTMDCGKGVPLCGTLVLETGQGDGVYHHDGPALHGMWPAVSPYGTSSCVAPQDDTDPEDIFECYQAEGGPVSHIQWFEQHEWQKHGTCAGVRNSTDFFTQVCALAAGPLKTLSGAVTAGLDLVGIADQMQRSGHCVWGTMAHSQIALSACAGLDGKWRLADVKDFPRVCGGGPGPAPGPAPPPPAPRCPRGRHGPACQSDADCAGVQDCLRCAHSGFCTDVPLGGPFLAPAPPVQQCVPGRHGPACGSDADCVALQDCRRCAHSGFCTDVPLGPTFFT